MRGRVVGEHLAGGQALQEQAKLVQTAWRMVNETGTRGSRRGDTSGGATALEHALAPAPVNGNKVLQAYV